MFNNPLTAPVATIIAGAIAAIIVAKFGGAK